MRHHRAHVFGVYDRGWGGGGLGVPPQKQATLPVVKRTGTWCLSSFGTACCELCGFKEGCIPSLGLSLPICIIGESSWEEDVAGRGHAEVSGIVQSTIRAL